jgi:hypothetical protein
MQLPGDRPPFAQPTTVLIAQEPSTAESHQSPASTALKKNRTDEETGSTTRTSPIPEDDPATKARETKTVSEVRRKVEKMSHAEGEEGADTDNEEGEGGAQHGKDLKRKLLERSESGAIVGESEAKRVKDSPSVRLS